MAEDDPVSRQVLESFLIKWGYELVVVEDGMAAWKVLERLDSPQLAILDWMIRTEDDSYQQLEVYISEHSDAEFSHGICPDCYQEHIVPQLKATPSGE